MKRFFCIPASLLFASALAAAEPFSEHDIGRILFVPRQHRTVQSGPFLVFERTVSENLIECHRYGSREKVRIAPDRTAGMTFFEDASPFQVTQYALYCFLKGQEHAPVVELAKVIGDTSGRMAALKQYEHARNQWNRALDEEQRRRLKGDIDTETGEENIRQMLEDSVLFEMAKKAAENHDFMLAVMMAQRYFHLAARNWPKYFPTQEGRQQAETVLLRQKETLMELYRAHFKAGAVRRARFRALCPQAKGLWCEAPAAAYDDLLRAVEISKNSFLKLDDLSSVMDFQDWGTAMLNVLLLVENSPAGRELETEFDQVLAERNPPEAAAP